MSLTTLTLHANPVTLEVSSKDKKGVGCDDTGGCLLSLPRGLRVLAVPQVLQSTDGWEELEQRRRNKFSKSIQGGASPMVSRGLDSGVDR